MESEEICAKRNRAEDAQPLKRVATVELSGTDYAERKGVVDLSARTLVFEAPKV